jgi:glycosyltransferase involved in cell wall biosynthesis
MKVIAIRSRSIDPAINKYCKSLSQNGYNVDLLVWDRQKNLKEKCVDDGFSIHTFRLKAPLDNPLVIFYLPFWWIYIFIYLLRNKCEIVHLSDLDTLIPGVFIKVFKKVKIVYTIFDFYADNIVFGNLLFLNSFIIKIIGSTERFLIRFCDLLILVDESRLEEVRDARIKKVIYIYNSPPDCLNEFDKIIYNDNQPFTIFYTGLLSHVRGVQYMINAVNELQDVKLILGGSLVDADIIPKNSKEMKNVHFIGWIPTYNDILHISLKSDVLFRFSDPEHPKTKNESPNKLFEAMMCSKPIIVSDCSSMADIVRKEQCGIVVPYGNVVAIKDAITQLQNNPELYKKYAGNGRKAYVEKYSWKIMGKRLIEAYTQL